MKNAAQPLRFAGRMAAGRLRPSAFAPFVNVEACARVLAGPDVAGSPALSSLRGRGGAPYLTSFEVAVRLLTVHRAASRLPRWTLLRILEHVRGLFLRSQRAVTGRRRIAARAPVRGVDAGLRRVDGDVATRSLRLLRPLGARAFHFIPVTLRFGRHPRSLTDSAVFGCPVPRPICSSPQSQARRELRRRHRGRYGEALALDDLVAVTEARTRHIPDRRKMPERSGSLQSRGVADAAVSVSSTWIPSCCSHGLRPGGDTHVPSSRWQVRADVGRPEPAPK